MLTDSLTGRNDSWYVRWTFDHFRNNTYSVFPALSYIRNIGHTIDGTHCKGINPYQSDFISNPPDLLNLPELIFPNSKQTKDYLYYFTFRNKLITRIKLLPKQSGRKVLVEDFIYKLKLR